MNKDKILSEIISGYSATKETSIEVHTAYRLLKNVSYLLLLDYHEANSLNARNIFIDIEHDLHVLIGEGKSSESFLEQLPSLRPLIDGTLEAIYQGDPAANSKEEIVLTYPGFQAITEHRIAHLFASLGEVTLARTLSEITHSETGIDIAPKATIGKNFFIDHGTGIVIGETTIIGDNVKLYQGATLGALSLADGRLLKDTKRHPTIEDNVTIYSNASILGGNTVIGHDSIIGANVYLTESVEPNTIVRLCNTGIAKIARK
ncbi:MAG: serine O-acetyltransferase [Bacilli bacterium]|nr:serine O-acetyltransferase [Bacilli bacterium]